MIDGMHNETNTKQNNLAYPQNATVSRISAARKKNTNNSTIIRIRTADAQSHCNKLYLGKQCNNSSAGLDISTWFCDQCQLVML